MDQKCKKMLRSDTEDIQAFVMAVNTIGCDAKKPICPLQKLIAKASKQIQKVLNRFKSCFKEELPEDLPPERDIEHPIDTRNAKPININAYPLSPVHLREQAQQIAKMLE
jgi:hypothetical protein